MYKFHDGCINHFSSRETQKGLGIEMGNDSQSRNHHGGGCACTARVCACTANIGGIAR